MQCIHCKKTIPEEILLYKPKNCMFCGGELGNTDLIDETFFTSLNVEQYPYPIAVVLHNLNEDIHRETSYLERIFTIKDFFEVTIKYIVILELAVCIEREDLTESLMENVLKDIARPSLGSWVKMARYLLQHNKEIKKPIIQHFSNV